MVLLREQPLHFITLEKLWCLRIWDDLKIGDLECEMNLQGLYKVFKEFLWEHNPENATTDSH